MTFEEKLEKARIIRERDKFGAMTPDEIAALPGSEEELSIPCGEKSVRVFELRPEGKLPEPCALIVNYHGGGFIKGRGDRDKRYCAALAQELCCLVWDVDYCLAPEEPFPAALHESYAVAAWAFSHAEELGVNPKRIALAGHSAGGNLVCAAMLSDREARLFHPCCLLMEYFPADQTREAAQKLTEAMRGDPWWQRRAETEAEYTRFYAEPEQLADSLCSPLFAPAGSFAAFPPCLIISAGTDTLRNEVEEMAFRLITEGVETTVCRVNEAMHGFTVNRTEGWEKAFSLHCKFFRQHLQ